MLSSVISDRPVDFQVLGWSSLGQARFADMKQDYHKFVVEQEEGARAVAKYREDLHTCKNELNRASEVVKSYRESLLAIEKEKEYADLERD